MIWFGFTIYFTTLRELYEKILKKLGIKNHVVRNKENIKRGEHEKLD